MKRLVKLWGAFTAIMLCGVLVAGCGGGGGSDGSSDTPTVSDPAPSVVYTTPVNNATDVGTASKITVTFSEAMDTETIKTDSFKLENITGTPTDVTLSSVGYDTANKIATITPSSLGANQKYRVTVNASVQDKAGKTMQSAYTWMFNTGSTVGVSPQLASKAPFDGATNVGTNTAVVMSFTKPMDISTFNSSSFTLQKTSDASTVTGTFSLVGKVVVFTPSALDRITDYTATVTTQAKDTSGISLAAQESWHFTTGSGDDTVKPIADLDSVDPQADATDVALRAPVSITFNEPIYPFLYGTIDGKAVDVEFDYSPTGTTTITMTPTADRSRLTVYQTGIAVSDLTQNHSIPYFWYFTTVP